MHSPDQQRTRHLTHLLRKIGIGQIAKSEEILKRGCGVVSESANTTPSPVFLRGALAQRTRTCNHWETLEQLADKSPPFGQRILNLGNRQDLGGNQSDRLYQFEQNTSVSLTTIIPNQVPNSRMSIKDLQIYNERVPVIELNQIYNIGDIEAKLYRETCTDVNGRSMSQIYTVDRLHPIPSEVIKGPPRYHHMQRFGRCTNHTRQNTRSKDG